MMSDETPAEAPVDDAVPVEEAPTEEAPSEEVVEEPEEERDPLEVALERAEFAEKKSRTKKRKSKMFASE